MVVLPAYNAERTLERTVAELPRDVVDEVLLIDDASHDSTVEVARTLRLPTLVHPSNLGYGGNQKTCYTAALAAGADVVVMVHPDYQYDPRLVPAMASLVASGVYDAVLGSRIIGNGALRGGMPRYKYVSNRLLTAFQNVLLGEKLSEYHTGYRAFSRRVLEALPLEANSDDFVFDNQILAQAFWFGFRVGEVSCPTRYQPESSSINFGRSCRYGLGVLWTSLQYRAAKLGLARSRIFDPDGPRLQAERLAERAEPPAEQVAGSRSGRDRCGPIRPAPAVGRAGRQEAVITQVEPEQPAAYDAAGSDTAPPASVKGVLTEPNSSPGLTEISARRGSWQRPALWCLVVFLLAVSIYPAYLGWRLIAAYAAIPTVSVTSIREVIAAIPNAPGMSGGQGLAVDPGGAIFVADENPKRVLAFPDGTSASGFVLGAATGPDKLQDPFGLALGPDGTVCVLDRATGVVDFYRQGAFLRSAKLASQGAKAIAVDDAGNIFVADSGIGVVRKFSPNGEPDLVWGDGGGTGTSKVGDINGLVVLGGDVYASVPGSIVRLGPDGRLKGRQRTIGNANMLAASPDGTLYMSDTSTHRIWILDRDGQTVGRVIGADGNEHTFVQPRGLAVPGDGNLYVVNDYRVNVYRILGPGGVR